MNYVNMLKILKEEFVKHPGSWKKRMCFFFDVVIVSLKKLMMEKKRPTPQVMLDDYHGK